MSTMALIKSISGIRGTIGGRAGEALTPVDIVRFSAAYGTWLKNQTNGKLKVVVGRDARESGPMVSSIVIATLQLLGIDVINLGLATTPTVEVAVTGLNASGGIIITASHNPAEWNALKLLNSNGEFLSSADGARVLMIAEKGDFDFVSVTETGNTFFDDTWDDKHIDLVLKMKLVDVEAIKKAGFRVAIDCVNSVGGIILPKFLKKLGVKEVIEINCTPDGNFSHNPEPLPSHLTEATAFVLEKNADVGFAVDPDVDRLAIICEDGTWFGEEYTLVAVSDFVLSHVKGNTVSNLSSSRALKDITEKHGCTYYSSAVGEVNVVEEMKLRKAVIGGEGNGGIIYPELHYGRDSLVGIALFLTHMAKGGMKCSELRRRYPDYFMAKKKVVLGPDIDYTKILDRIRKTYSAFPIDERDGMRIDFPFGWVQIRKSNTEPILRIYSEGDSMKRADSLADEVISLATSK